MGVSLSRPIKATVSAVQRLLHFKKPTSISWSHGPPKPTFRFQDLPGELRNQIYGYVLTEPAGYCLSVQRRRCFCGQYQDQLVTDRKRIDFCLHRPGRRISRVGMLLTCRSINQECSPLLYALNTFRFHRSLHGYTPEHAIKVFLVRIGKKNAAALKSVVLSMGNDSLGVFTMSFKTYVRRTLTFARNHPSANIQLEASVLHGLEHIRPGRHHYRRWLEVSIDVANLRQSMECLREKVIKIRDESEEAHEYPLDVFLAKLSRTMERYCPEPGRAAIMWR
ncbi:putative mitochondrial 2-oxodicarboxylate carrier [Teratosphaeria destructans]|uniref:Mitochondrial 2-oxodicarboxylate carrier n=1 Tax=Teratosphaeria destructans TaxID=418781 RepID=A0A9W7W5C2_9PEZI|nr:putative mitochondrial 2-oxodicarboxylate carrier [Teratosphaeria destructans]